MGAIRCRPRLASIVLGLAALSVIVSPAVRADSTAGRHLVNAWEVHDEIQAATGSEAAVKDYFPSFLEYQDLVMFHPKFGYYASGRVNFTVDYQTYPIVLNPFFGQMIAEQIFRMWQGMRHAGSLGAGDPFTIAEFGAGNGLMAEAIMDYLERRAKDESEPAWREFNAQTRYVCYDRSPALSEAQRRRNARFGKRFEAREADATDPTAAIAAGSLKGVILSNELPDTFSVHKVILSADGAAEVAFVAPSLSRTNWDKLRKEVPAGVADAVAKGDRAVKARLFADRPDRVYLTRPAFVALLETLVASQDYASAVQSIEFHEVYVPAYHIPELGGHLRRYARLYANELAKAGRGVVTYINLGVESFIQGAGRILSAGYVITLDYGTNWEGIMAQDAHPHLRTYGPAHMAANQSVEPDSDDNQPPAELDTSDPYRGPTLNDMTTDVNFSLMEAEGRLAGLTNCYFGAQAALQAGTPISLDSISQQGDVPYDEFYSWASSFQTDANYKLMVQQKRGTDAAYVYPYEKSERLASDETSMDQAQRQKAADIEKRLIAASQAPER